MTDEINRNDYISCSNPRCRAVIGRYIERRGKIWLKVGGLALHVAHGECDYCGTDYHWSVSDQSLETLINRAKRLRDLDIP